MALKDFNSADKLFELTYDRTHQYHSLPDVIEGVKSQWAETLLNMGVAYERAGQTEASENAYFKCLRIEPGTARAHYNIAVLYWNKDWEKAVDHLREALKIDPNNPDARSFYAKASYALEMSRKK